MISYLSLEVRVHLNVDGVVRTIEDLETEAAHDDEQRGSLLHRGHIDVVDFRPGTEQLDSMSVYDGRVQVIREVNDGGGVVARVDNAEEASAHVTHVVAGGQRLLHGECALVEVGVRARLKRNHI